MRIIDKTGPLANPADRDHCLQYMVAVPLIFGRLTADDYEDDVARDPRIDALRAKMTVTENATFSRDYLDPDKRAIGNARADVVHGRLEAPSASPSTIRSVTAAAARKASRSSSRSSRAISRRVRRGALRAIEAACADQAALEALPVRDFMALWVPQP